MLEERPVLLNADGRTLLYHEVVDQAGADAPWLVFVHGAGGSIRTWKYQIEAFQPHYRLLLIDLRDHGFSKDILPEFPEYDFDIVSDDILAVVDHLGIERAHFVSLSIGSVILQKIDIERPELIDRMVMAGAIFDGSRLMHWFVHSGKLLNYILPYRAIYWLFSFIVLPRRNHRLSRWIFRRQSLRLTPGEYSSGSSSTSRFSDSSSSMSSAQWTKRAWWSWGRRTTSFLVRLRSSPAHRRTCGSR